MSAREMAPQREFWALIDTWSDKPGWLCRKQIEAELDVDKSTVSLWSTGARPMPVWAWVAACRLFRARGEHHRALELMQLLGSRLDMDILPVAPTLSVAGVQDQVLDVDELTDDMARMVRRLTRDGELCGADRAELRPHVLKLLRHARELAAALDGGSDE
jgi:hypothetical protein